MRVLLNAANVTAAGPRTLLLRLLPRLAAWAPHWRFTALLPDLPEYRGLPLPPNLDAEWWPRVEKRNDLARLRQLLVRIPRAASERSADVCVTLGDVGPLALRCPHVIFLHLALLVYSPAELRGVRAWGAAKRRYLGWHFGQSVRRAASVVVQTPIMAHRVAVRYGVSHSRIRVIPQPPAIVPGNDTPPHPVMERFDKAVRLLFLAASYAHKNHGVLAELAAELRRRGLAGRVHIFVTLDESESATVALRARLRREPHVITNLGRLSEAEVASAWRSASALFLPTLVESFGMTYLESLAAGKPVLTSDRDFARWMCGDLAIYFDPTDVRSIANAIERFVALADGVGDGSARDALGSPEVFRGRARHELQRFPRDWDEVAREFLGVITDAGNGSVAVAG